MRFWMPVIAAVLLASPVSAGGEGLAGNWKVTIVEDGQYLNFWLLKLESKDGKLTGTTEPLMPGVIDATVKNIVIDGDLITFTLSVPRGSFSFEGKLPRAGGKKVLGSMQMGGTIPNLAFLESTPAKNALEVNVDLLTRSPNDPRVFGTLIGLISQAKEKKLPAREVKEWTDGVLKTAESYGPVWQTEFGVRVLSALETPYPDLAAETGAQIEKSLDPKAPVETQLRLLTALSGVYKTAGKAEALAKVDARMASLEGAAHAESLAKELSFKIEPYVGKVGQPVLVELFTGAQCPPCVAADIGFDALGKAFKSTEVVLLEYHLHVPDSDALTNPACEARAEFYGKTLQGTPAIYFNGQPLAPGGGDRARGEEKYKDYRAVVDKLIAKEPGGKVSVTANRKGDVITIQTSASTDVKGKVKLRLAITEDWLRYKARNGLTYHHHVVRAMPGGPEGFPVDKKLDNSIVVDMADVRAKLAKYLDDHAKTEGFPDSQRPLRLRDLQVVAFLQNDDTGEVLQATAVAVKGE